MKPVLDACCGARMFWFDSDNPLAIFMDNRSQDYEICDGTKLLVRPDIVADFTKMPFENESFYLVVFDPPHLENLGTDTGWLAQKYGRLVAGWREMIRQGFNECFRVLRPYGTLIFKWNSFNVPLKEVVALSPVPPLFGHVTNRLKTTHWICFIKDPEAHKVKAEDTVA